MSALIDFYKGLGPNTPHLLFWWGHTPQFFRPHWQFIQST